MLFLFLSVDDSHISSTIHMDIPYADWQNALLKLFFKDISEDGLQKIQTDPDDCSTWDGITRTRQIVTGVQYAHIDVGNFHLPSLPPTVEDLFLNFCKQRFQLHTRSLPRRLQELLLPGNKIYGVIDLTTLPPQLEKVNMWNNRLTGPIVLTQLPRTMTHIYLDSNPIAQRTVWYDNLPEHIESIDLMGTQVETVRSVSGFPVEKRQIFNGVRKANIF